MHWTRILGIALIVAGAIMLYMGWTATESFTEQASEALTGRYTEDTRIYLIGGAVAAVVGFALLFFGVKR
jgi:di/tricarboxylate transporter